VALSRRQPALAPGDVVDGRFRLLEELGEGGMSRVYEAVDLKYDRPAAVKVLARWLAEDEEFRRRFERESAAAERVTHPHVLPVWDHGEQDGLLFLVTPLCDADLGGLLGEHGRLAPDRALATIAQVAWALDWAHERGVIHRDVKPENILLISGPGEDHVYLADFGLAKIKVETTLTQAGQPAGLTPAYAAPEQWLDEPVGPAADQYALAATLFTCLAGHPPFHPRRGPSLRHAHVHEHPPELTGVVPGLPGGLDEAVGRALAKDPADRYETCREFVTAAQIALQRARSESRRPSGEPDSEERAARSTILSPEAPGAWTPTQPEGTTPEEAAPSVRPPEGERASGPPAEAPPSEPPRSEPPPAGRVPSEPPPAGPPPTPPPAAEPPGEAAPALAPAAAASAPAAPAPAPAAAGRSRRALLAAALVAVVAAVVAVALLAGSGGDSGGRGGGPGTVEQLRVGRAPIDVAAGPGGVFVANSGEATVSRIAPRAGVVRDRAIPAVRQPFGLAVDEQRVWVVGGDGELAGIDPRSGRRLVRADLGIQADALAAGFGAVWIANVTAGTVTRVDVSTGTPGATRTIGTGSGTADVAVGLGAVWAVNSGAGTLVRMDPATGRTTRTEPVRGGLDRVAVGEGAVWAISAGDGKLIRVDPDTWRMVAIDVPRAVSGADVAVGDGAVFYVNHDDGTATRFDAATRRQVGKPVRVATEARGAAVRDRALWVPDNERGTLARLTF
jgi:serine/threonine-protein kinase